MECARALYRQRDPAASPLYRLFDEHYEDLKRVYPERFETLFGPWQRHWDAAVAAFLSCGDLACGFARVYCDTCRKEFLLPYSCKKRSLCPSCDARRRVAWADHVIENVLPDVPHCMIVFTMPKHLRGIFLRERAILGDLCREAYRVTARFLAEHFPGVDVCAVHTFGSSAANPHPHVHALCSLGIKDRQGTFHRAPEDLDFSPLEELFRHAVLAMLLRKHRITEETTRAFASWQHSGFSAHARTASPEGDRETLHRLACYLLKPPVSLHCMTYESGASKVVYHGTRSATGRCIEVYDPQEFLVRVLLHIPAPWEVRIRYYGAASSTARRRGAETSTVDAPPETTSTFVKARRRTWAKLIARVYGADPLRCKHCGSRMRIISFILDPEVVEKILRHLGRWRQPRGPPAKSPAREYRVVYDEPPPPDDFVDDLPPLDPCDRPWHPKA
jgi:hypothetical protein